MEYDVNKLFRILKNLLIGYAPENYGSLEFTSNTSYPQGLTDYSFCKAYSSIEGIEGYGGEYRPGNVLDILFNKGASSYFVSLFFDTGNKIVEYRLIKLHDYLTPPLADSFYRMPEIASDKDRLIDEGSVLFGTDYVDTGNIVTGWLRHQIDTHNVYASAVDAVRAGGGWCGFSPHTTQ